MTDKRATVYRTAGCREPAPYGLFDDEFHFISSGGGEFHLWSEETNYLFSAIHWFQFERALIPLPVLPIVDSWNTLTDVFDSAATPTILKDLRRLINALRVLQAHYPEFVAAGKDHGYSALSPDDLSALIDFLVNASTNMDSVVLAEH